MSHTSLLVFMLCIVAFLAISMWSILVFFEIVTWLESKSKFKEGTEK